MPKKLKTYEFILSTKDHTIHSVCTEYGVQDIIQDFIKNNGNLLCIVQKPERRQRNHKIAKPK